MDSTKGLRLSLRVHGIWYGEFSTRAKARAAMQSASTVGIRFKKKVGTKMFQCIPSCEDTLVFIVRVEFLDKVVLEDGE